MRPHPLANFFRQIWINWVKFGLNFIRFGRKSKFCIPKNIRSPVTAMRYSFFQLPQIVPVTEFLKRPPSERLFLSVSKLHYATLKVCRWISSLLTTRCFCSIIIMYFGGILYMQYLNLDHAVVTKALLVVTHCIMNKHFMLLLNENFMPRRIVYLMGFSSILCNYN